MSSNIKTQLTKKEELQDLLAQYKSILNDEVMEYLTELLELKTSVIKRMQLEQNKNKILGEIPLYKQIAIYNIYYRALNIAKEVGIEPVISDKESSNLSLSTKIGKDSVPLFLFHTSIKEKENENSFGIIDLYRVMFDADVRAQMLDEIRTKLQKLKNEKNPYPDLGTFGGLDTEWEFEHDEEIEGYKKVFNKLVVKKELSDGELRQIELTQHMQQLLIKDYGLTQDSFVNERAELLKHAKNEEEKYFLRCQFALEDYTSPYAIKSTEKEIVLVKKLPNIEIRNITKYII